MVGGVEERKTRGCVMRIPSTNPSPIVSVQIGQRRPHCRPPWPVIPHKRTHEGGSVLRRRNENLDPNGLENRRIGLVSLRLSSWCRRRDLNPHGLRHTPLKRACLPFHHFGPSRKLKQAARIVLASQRSLTDLKRPPRALLHLGFAGDLFEQPATQRLKQDAMVP